MPIGRLETQSRPSRAGSLPQEDAFQCGSEPARDGAGTFYDEVADYPTIPRTMKNNSEGPSRHPSPVWKVAVNAP